MTGVRRDIVIFAAGSRGDVQPCVALGRGLAERGHGVRLIIATGQEPLAAGLDTTVLSVDPARLLETDEVREWLRRGHNPLTFVAGFRRVIRPMAEMLLGEILAGCKDADLLVFPTLGFVGHHLAEYLGIDHALIHFQPSQPTSAFRHPLVSRACGANRLSYHLVEQLAWQLIRPILSTWRRDTLALPKPPLGGPVRTVRDVPVLACFSEAVVPRPPDWPPHVHVTGYWFLDEPAWTPDPRLTDFLAAGPPPVYVGFGSMTPPRPEAMVATVRAALRAAGLRGILAFGEDGADDDVLTVGDVPHSWLLPRTLAAVHHGGAGTTAAALRAGIPAVVCPFFGDQGFWGGRVAALGAGPAPLPIKRLAPEPLTARITAAAGDERMRRRAAELGRRIAAEDGVGRACAALEDARWARRIRAAGEKGDGDDR
ncbi:glycosyltransferase [Actinoallomurus spadix]|uniref:Glycosyltransferase n=1 Tax=Actinoallomurus spadix TaxID=79912 RepID=A0ABN0WSY5_9ACTN|nr:glycosyltransferase [Actinoallomurus spadix]MCO5990164.1 glycosyltransferase [Actinoallomurus spadix]